MHFSVVALALAVRVVVAGLLPPMPVMAHGQALRFQPLMDFDKDVCYQTTAIAADGRINQGLPVSPSVAECRNENRLWHSNTYSREKCNHYWCAYMYGYYSEMDRSPVSGHVHDWEHVIVWTLHNEVRYVSWSAHGDYTTEYFTGVRFDGSRPKMVSHRGTFNTASIRKATAGDEAVENHLGRWFTGHLVSVEAMPTWLRNNLFNHNFGSAHMDLKDSRFSAALAKAVPWDATNNEGFNPWA